MEFKGKALFNLLRISWLEEKRKDVLPWQVEDLRGLSMDQLFLRLKNIGLILNEQGFSLYAENCDNPEELTDCLWDDDNDLEGHDKTYLLLFELWRRLKSDKMCLSIFCDELDQMIELYDSDNLLEEETLQKALSMLEDILDETYDEKPEDASAIFNEVASYCAHDLRRFIFDYIYDQLLEKNDTYASEMIDGFYDYCADRKRFDFLRAKLFAVSDLKESNIIYGRILEEDPDLELILMIAENLVLQEDGGLFRAAVKLALPLIKTEEEFQNLLQIIASYYRCLDREKEENLVQDLLKNHAMHDLETCKQITQMLNQEPSAE